MSTTLVVDGNSLAHRAYHGYKKADLRNASGEAWWAVYGFFALLCGVCDKVSPDRVLVGFDDPLASRRREKYPAYKAQRSEKDPELVSQLAVITGFCRELGLLCETPSGYEADDVVAAVAQQCDAAGEACVIATSDRDAFSLLSPHVSVLRLATGLDQAVLYSPATLFEKYGVAAEHYLEFAALRGDASDNLPGVLGIGEKTAAKLFLNYTSLAEALNDSEGCARVLGKAASAKLLTPEARENIERNLDLMSPLLGVVILDGTGTLPLDSAVVEELFGRYELPGLKGRAQTALTVPVGDSGAEVAALLAYYANEVDDSELRLF